tara:strand:+ start:885 stop:1409 length:525 start_codon:yes stop_codon:yes gene_type:complete
MAQTDLMSRTSQQKLNSMAVDLITITPTVQNSDTDAIADLLFDAVEISNATAVEGGTSILQSVSVFHKGNKTVTFDLVFFQVTKDLGSAGAALTWGGSSETTNADEAVLLGHVSVGNWCDLVDVQIATKNNIGLVLQSASGTKSIYCAGICRSAASGAHGATDNIDIRLGIVKD